MTTIAILGSGSVGQALAAGFLRAGAVVRFGARDPQSAATKLGGAASVVSVMTPVEAADGAEIVVLAVPAPAALEAARSAGDLTGKILLDCTNPLRWDGGPVWAPPAEGSVSRQLAAAVPGARVIKGFNHFGAEIQRNPALVHGPADAFFAGDHGEAKSRVMELAQAMGFVAHDAGPLRNAAVLENLAMLWIHLASVGGKGRQFSFTIEGRAT